MQEKLHLASLFYLAFFLLCLSACKKNDELVSNSKLQINAVNSATFSLLTQPALIDSTNEISVLFNVAINTTSVAASISIKDQISNVLIPLEFSYLDLDKIIKIKTKTFLTEGAKYTLIITQSLKGKNKETFNGLALPFEINKKPLELIYAKYDTSLLVIGKKNKSLPLNPRFEIKLSHFVLPDELAKQIVLVGKNNHELAFTHKGDNVYTFNTKGKVPDFSKFNLLFPPTLGSSINRSFKTISFVIYSDLDTTSKFPIISNESLLTKIQSQTFTYFWDFGHPTSGMARERNTSGDIVTSGGTGFGLMAMIVAIERGFISRNDALMRWKKILDFLERADRFHGVWSHWIHGVTGRVVPFSTKDDGGDLVETAFLIQGLLTVKEYLNKNNQDEMLIIDRIDKLWKSVEWSWYTQSNQKVLYWHWSPKYNWEMNHQIRGNNETLIVYVLAASSPTYSIDKQTYTAGYSRNGAIRNGKIFYGINLPLGEDLGGPLFFTHYSFLGLDPRKLKDQYADYWIQNVNHSKINQAYCKANPLDYIGYSSTCWGLTASDNESGYNAHSPTNDRGVISPTAAISSLPYTPIESMDAINFFYYQLGDRIWGAYGFVDAFNITQGWYANSYLAIDQGPIICMIENHRTGLLWNTFMRNSDVKTGLDLLGFSY